MAYSVEMLRKEKRQAEFIRDAVVREVANTLYSTAQKQGDCGMSADDMEFLSDMIHYVMENVERKAQAVRNAEDK